MQQKRTKTTSEKRERLVANAFRLFYRQGFHATGVEQLAKDAGVTKRTLYSYFPAKEDLVLAALEYRDAQFLARLQPALEAQPATQAMQAYAEFLIAWSQELGFNGCAFINASAEYARLEDPAHRISDSHKFKLRQVLLERIRQSSAPDPEAAASALLLLGEGYVVMSQISGSAGYQEELRKLAALLAHQYRLEDDTSCA
jgi:AcrR family transcriptional regulator